jgi:hypothetical protein
MRSVFVMALMIEMIVSKKIKKHASGDAATYRTKKES